MPATINPIRKALLKQNIIKNKGTKIEQSMIDAGYAPATAHKTTANKVVKVIQAEIVEDIKKTITIDYVLAKLKHFVDYAKNDADKIRATELLGKWQAMFTDKQEVSTIEKEDNQFSLERLSRLKQAQTG